MPKSRVKELIRDGKVQPHTEIRPASAKTWKRVADVKGFIGKGKKKRPERKGPPKTVEELLLEDAQKKQLRRENFINLLILLSPVVVGLYFSYLFSVAPGAPTNHVFSFLIGFGSAAIIAYPILLFRVGISWFWRLISFLGYRGGGYDSSRTVDDTISKPTAVQSKPLFEKVEESERNYNVLPEQTACACCRYDQVSPASGIIIVPMTKKVNLSHKSYQVTTTNALEPICRACGDELKRKTWYGIKIIPIALIAGVCVTAFGHLVAIQSAWEIGNPGIFYSVVSLMFATPFFLILGYFAPSKRQMSALFDEYESIIYVNGHLTEESKVALKRSPDFVKLLEDGFTPTVSFHFLSGFYVRQLSQREVNASERSSIPLEAWLLDEKGLQKRFGFSKGTQIAKKKAFYLEKWQGKEA